MLKIHFLGKSISIIGIAVKRFIILSIIIEIKDSLEYSLFNGDTAICLGSTVNIIGTMDSGMTMQWTPANNVLNPNQFLTSITPTVIGSQKYTIVGSFGTCVPIVKSFTITTSPLAYSNIRCLSSRSCSEIYGRL